MVTYTTDDLRAILPEILGHTLECARLREARQEWGRHCIPRHVIAEIRRTARVDGARLTREALDALSGADTRPDPDRPTPGLAALIHMVA